MEFTVSRDVLIEHLENKAKKNTDAAVLVSQNSSDWYNSSINISYKQELVQVYEVKVTYCNFCPLGKFVAKR